MTDLAKRLLACPRFRWMPGMRTVCGIQLHKGGHNFIAGYHVGTARRPEGIVESYWVGFSAYLPDLTDPATLGCLLALVREVYQDPNMTLHFHSFLGVDDGHERGRGWTWLNHGHEIMPIGWHKSEAEALVAALEAA